MKNAFIILGNGFTIDFLNHFFSFHTSKEKKIDVKNLFKFGDLISTPWNSPKPGFLSYRHCPSLWTLGARPSNSTEECMSLIEEIITCANMYFDFINESKNKDRLEKIDKKEPGIYLKAYYELIAYLRQLFTYYNDEIDDNALKESLDAMKWGWTEFFKAIKTKDKYSSVTFVTYNYDIWLERILKLMEIPFSVNGFEDEESIRIIKPHGSISFVPSNQIPTYSITYKPSFEATDFNSLTLEYENLGSYSRGAIIPPAGDSNRISTPWSEELKKNAISFSQKINENDDVVICGISYWHVDRREIDKLLLNLNENVNLTFVNPDPPKDLNAVLTSIFNNYILQTSSDHVGGILNG